jgi:hypothetical protein
MSSTESLGAGAPPGSFAKLVPSVFLNFSRSMCMLMGASDSSHAFMFAFALPWQALRQQGLHRKQPAQQQQGNGHS